MLINKENFQSILPDLESYIIDCDFASFDIEMTGISNHLKNDGTTFDSHQFRYSKCREIVKQFEIIQFGLTLYHKKEIKKEESNNIAYLNGHSNIYLERTFNFQLLKNTKFSFINSNEYENAFENNSNFHPASMKFMNLSKFDFDNLYKNGIHYNKLLKRELIERAFKEKVLKPKKNFNPILYLKEKNEEILINEIIEITKFLLNDTNDHIINIDTSSNNENNTKKNSELVREELPISVINYLINMNFNKLLNVSGFNIFVKEAIINQKQNASIVVKKSRSKLNNLRFLEKFFSFENFKSNLNMELIQNCRYYLNESNLDEENNFNMQLEKLVNEELGFARVISLLINYKKVIIGHNIFFDILFLYDKLIDDLPVNFYEFKKNFKEIFPVIYDTKYIATSYAKDFNLTKLEEIYHKIIKDKLNIYTIIKQDIYRGFAFYSEIDGGGSLLHDAGYDSILTGRSFIYLMKAIENNFCTENKEEKINRIGNKLINQTNEILIKRGLVNFNFSVTKLNFLYEDIVSNKHINNEENKIWHLKDFANKTLLGLLENPYEIVDLNESSQEFDLKEKNLIEKFRNNVFYIEFKDDLMTIYEMCKNINCENMINNDFNLRIIKNCDNGALVEFKFSRVDYVEDYESLLNQSLEKLKKKSNINKILTLNEYLLCK